MKLGTRFIALIVVTVGCSSSNFEVTEGPTTETSVADDTATVDTGLVPGEDAEPPPADSTNNGGEVSVEAGTGCGAVSNPTEIWVDGTTAGMAPNGTAACPFRHIGAAIAYANTLDPATARAIKVKPGIYTEPAALILRKGLTLTGSGAGVTKLSGGGTCTSSTSGYKCIVRVDGGATLERVTIDASGGGKHGVVTGEPAGAFPIVRSTVISGATGSCCSGLLVTNGALLGPNIESTGNGYGLVIWGSQPVKVMYGTTNKFDSNTVIGINHEGTGALTFEGGSVSNNTAGVKLGEPVPTLPPVHVITGLFAKNNIEYGVKVMGVASAKIRNSTFTGSKFGVIAFHGASNYIDLGTAGSVGGNNFGNPTIKNSLAGVCAMFTRMTPLDATGNTFPECSTPRSLADIGTEAGCEAVTSYADVWYRGVTLPITASCTKAM